MPKTEPASRKSLYSVHPAVYMTMKWVAELKEKTGRSLEEWIAFCKKSGPPTEAARRDWLKKEHGLGTNASWWIAERVEGKGDDDDTPEKYLASADRYVEKMFTGPKSTLRPIYDALLELGLGIAEDVKACPCKTIVPLFRNYVIAQIKPATRSRIDVGLALGKHKGKLPARLIDTGGLAKRDRITHRLEITSLKDIDAEVKRWLKTAYDLDA